MRKVVVITAALLLAGVVDGPVQLKTGAMKVAQAQPPTMEIERIVNVTQAVAVLVKDNALTVTSSNALVGGGDPAPMVLKKLVLTYTLDEQETTVAVMEGQSLKINAPQGKILTVQNALYGDADFPVLEITELLKGMVVDNKVALTVDNQSLAEGSDPAPYKRKRLRVSYTVGGDPKVVTVDEGTLLNLPLLGEPVGALVISSAIYGEFAN